jgi:hypothetical protein
MGNAPRYAPSAIGTIAAAVSLAILVAFPAVGGEDLDVGAEADVLPTPRSGSLEQDCYGFGGISESFSGTNRGRGNTYTVTSNETLVEVKMELDFTGNANLYFYVLESATLDGTYTVASETIVPTVGAGQAFYSSGLISVPLDPGRFYGIGVAWGPETITYLRDPASLPRNWALGTVEDAMQIGEAPPYMSLTYNHFPLAEYSIELCFLGATPVEDDSWGHIKAVYR